MRSLSLEPNTPEYQMCVRTVMDTTDPEIWFNEYGVSSHALKFDRSFASILEANATGASRHELGLIVAEIKSAGTGKPYDCIIGVSGGVDSSYLALQAVRLGLRPLLVHFDSGWNSELAVGNIANIVERLGLDLYTQVADWREMKDLQLAFFKASVPNADIPTDHAFASVAYEQAKKYGVKYVLSGHNLVSESILPTAWGYDAGDAPHLRAIHRRFGTRHLKSYPVFGHVKRYVWYEIINGIKSVAPLNLMPFNYKTAKAEITSELGWRDYGGKHHESVFTRYFQGYYLPTKFGFDKRKAHLSSLILAGQLSRDDALAELEGPPYDEGLLKQDHEFIAKKLGVTTTELQEIFALQPKAHSEYPTERLWPYLDRMLVAIALATKPFRR
jgi:N-acetyl sugar amidotransferase